MSELLAFLEPVAPGIKPETAIAVLAGIASAVMAYVVLSGLIVRDPMVNRAKALAKRQSDLRAGLLQPTGHHSRRATGTVGFMTALVRRFNMLRTDYARQVKLKLAQAGFRSNEALVTFLFLRASLPIVFGIAAAVLLFATPFYPGPFNVRLFFVIACVALGLYAPAIYVRNAAQKRIDRIRKGLPDALDLMVICAEAGLSLDAALKRVAEETAGSDPDVADEFGLTAIELGFLPDRREALINLTKRVTLPSVRGVVNTLLQTEKYGTPLAQSLRVLSNEFRSERLMKAEEKAAKLPATLTVPLVAFILPTLFVVLLGPAVLRSIDGLSSL